MSESKYYANLIIILKESRLIYDLFYSFLIIDHPISKGQC